VTRTLPALRLARSPLVYVVAEVRISAVVSIEEYVPKIQDRLRGEGFPRFQKGAIQEIKLSKQSAPELTSVGRYEFQEKAGQSGVVITPYAVSFHTARYTCYEEFEDRLRLALQIINDILQISLSERLGLRYVDLIKPDSTESFASYLDAGLLGLDLTKTGVEEVQSSSESIGKTGMGTLVVKTWKTRSDRFLPPDLSGSTLVHSVNVDPQQAVTLLDLDHYTEGSTDFELERVLGSLGQLHDSLDQVFRQAVTPYALQKWGHNEGSQ
jgi:uncharacterized protein (TIGR04255 family)